MSLSSWANLAAIWLAFLCFVGMLIPLAIAFFAVKGMHIAVDRTPRLFHRGQEYSSAMRRQVERAGRRTVDQVVKARTAGTRMETRITRTLGLGPNTDSSRRERT